MQTVNIRELKNNPSTALRQAKEELMMVTNRNKPDALLVSMEQLEGIPNLEQVRLVLAINLFKDKQLTVAAAAKVAGKTLAEMLTLLSEMGIPVVDYSEQQAKSEFKLVKKLVEAQKNK